MELLEPLFKGILYFKEGTPPCLRDERYAECYTGYKEDVELFIGARPGIELIRVYNFNHLEEVFNFVNSRQNKDVVI